ncbi:unnamed protein product, partial [marine sediment metagenome]
FTFAVKHSDPFNYNFDFHLSLLTFIVFPK